MVEELSKGRPEAKILYMSGYARGILEKHSFDEGKATFLQNPSTLSMLEERVREVLTSIATCEDSVLPIS